MGRVLSMFLGLAMGMYIVCGLPYSCLALTAGASYTVDVDGIASDGNIVDLSFSTTVTADTNGKISFTFTGLPTRDTYNFLLVTVKDSSNVTVRRSIAPAPASGSTTNLGVSPMTEAQTEALLSAMQTAGSTDPILVLFGGIIIRSGGFTSAEITHLANIARLGIINGLLPYLEAKIGIAKMTTFKSAILDRLASYSSYLKSAVDAADTSTARNQRAQAAGILSQILIEAAAEADFDVGYITAAMKAASDQVEDYLASISGTDNDMSEAAIAAMDAVMAANYMKLTAERVRKKYTIALSTLGASSAQITRFNNAITTLSEALISAFQKFEEVFDNEEQLDDAEDINDKFSEIDAEMNSAFNQFISDSASTDAEIDTMISAMATGFEVPEAELNNLKDEGVFTFRDMAGNVNNWPITMVVPVTWVANNHASDLTYTRDTLEIPQAMWLNQRSTYDPDMPTSLIALFSLREDIEIIMARKWAGLAAASQDMTQAGYNTLSGADKTRADNYISQGNLTIITTEDSVSADDTAGASISDFFILEDLSPYLTGEEVQGIEDLYISRLEGRKSALSSSDPNNPLTSAQKDALIDTAMMPDFH